VARTITAGVDIGTHHVKVVVAEMIRDGARSVPRVIGTGFAESKGLRHGYIINSSDAIKSIRSAIDQAEKRSGVKIKKAYVSFGGIGLGSIVSNGTVVISRADSEISELDINKVFEVAESDIPSSYILNRKILHTIPLQYKIDGKPVLGRPLGMKGVRLEAKILFITCLEHHLNDMIDAIVATDIDVADVMASPIAASFVTLTKTQKIAGSVLANIGAETVSIVVFENGIPISLEVFPIGSTDITNDIALGLKIPLEEAEQIKLGGITSTSYPRKKLEEIVSARLSDMFELIEAHLKKIGKNSLLPAGIIITGGGSGIGTIEDLAKASLNLPSQIASLHLRDNPKNQIKDGSWSVAYGLCILGFHSEDEKTIGIRHLARGARRSALTWIRQFLP